MAHGVVPQSPTLYMYIKLSSDIMLDGAYYGGGASPVGLQGHVVCCSGRMGLQQQQRCKLFMQKAKVVMNS